jgi:hypothetical protein
MTSMTHEITDSVVGSLAWMGRIGRTGMTGGRIVDRTEVLTEDILLTIKEDRLIILIIGVEGAWVVAEEVIMTGIIRHTVLLLHN